MRNNRINECPRISPRQDKTDFTNITMENGRQLLLKLVSINGQSIYVAMLHKKFRSFAGFCVVELAIGIHAFVSIFEKCMPKNAIGIIVIMAPTKRNGLTVVVFERIFQDCPSVRAFKISFGRPTAKIKFSHFDFLPPFVVFFRQLRCQRLSDLHSRPAVKYCC